MKEIAYISFGSNLGDRKQNVDKAVGLLRQNNQIIVIAVSSYTETEPVGGPSGQGKYLNGVIKIETQLNALELLSVLNDIESDLGRIRTEKNSPRTIDLDILFYGDQVIDTVELTVPHPRMFERNFVIEPLLEIEPEIKNHPLFAV